MVILRNKRIQYKSVDGVGVIGLCVIYGIVLDMLIIPPRVQAQIVPTTPRV